jgi:hypothetical protein
MKSLTAALSLILLLLPGCVKETYDLEKLSRKAEISPVLVFPFFKGSVVLSDAVKESDTVVFDDDKFVRLVYRKDSIINLSLEDYIDVENLVSFNDSYTVGEIAISPFQGSLSFTLDEVSRNFSAPLRSQFVSLDDGAAHPFPAFPSVTLGNKSFTVFPNFEHAVFYSGFLDISVTNNFTAPLNGVQVTLSTSLGTLGVVTLPQVNPGQTQSNSLDLAGKEITNLLTASITLTGSPGNASPVLIDLDNSNISFSAGGRNLKVTSGRVVVPPQTISDPGSTHTVVFNPGEGIELDKLRINSGTLNWNATFNGDLNATLDLLLPAVIRNSVAVTERINVTRAGSHGSLNLPNTVANFNSVPETPFNRIPIDYSLSISSNNTLVDFNSSEQVHVDLNLTDASFDYIKGYFGQRVEIFEPESLDFGIEDYLRNISGTISLADPSIKINYRNSFALPIQVKLDGLGRKLNETVSLGLEPFLIVYPAALAEREVSADFSVSKANSSLPQLISLPPESVVFSGSATLNPGGDPNHLRNNYLFGNSRLVGSVEMELPLELTLKNLQLADTIENHLLNEDLHGDIGIDDLELASIGLNIKNGFPFDVEVKVSLYDSATRTVKSTINATGLIKAAPVDSNGKVNGISESATTIEVTPEFLDNIEKSDQLIFSFIAGTTGSKNVKIYSDYRIDFNITAHLITKIEFKL